MKTVSLKIKSVIYAVFFICFCYGPIKLAAQDLHFSQYCNSPLSLNPSLAGAFNGDIRLLTNYRDQWKSISTPYKTFAFSGDMGLFRKKTRSSFLGSGISFISDKAGTSQLSINQVSLSLAYHVQISGYNTFSAGIQGGFTQRSINFDNLKWDNQYNGNSFDPSLPTYEANYDNNLFYSDFAGGIQWTYTRGEMYATANNQLNINAGAAMFHINQPNISFYPFSKDLLPIKIVLHGNSQIGFKNSKVSLLPSIIYIQQGPLKNIITGGFVRIKLVNESKYTGYIKGAALSFGGLCRINDAIIPVVQFEFAQYAIGMSYDVNTSDLINVSSGKGGFEISLRFINPNPFTGKTISIKTPRFFN
ncbi:MAG: PorP/SprF family type IX secretion system membrane protein [Bacteroidota bacterium]